MYKFYIICKSVSYDWDLKSICSQMWELNNSGALMNSYSGLCATVSSVEGDNFKQIFYVLVANILKIFLFFFNYDNSQILTDVLCS